MARGGHDVHLEVADRDDVALAEPLVAEPVGRVEGAYAAADRLGELPGGLGVVEVVVGQQHDGDVTCRLADRSRWPGSGGPGSTTTEREPPGSRSTQVLVPSRVMWLALGASTQVPRSPEGAAGPAHLSASSAA